MAKGAEVPPHKIVQRGFHGTSHNYLNNSDLVLPHGETGVTNFDFSGERDTYFLPAEGESAESNERQAWNWSSYSQGMSQAGTSGRKRVHVTEPEPFQHIDRNLHGSNPPDDERAYDIYARVAPRQRIVDTMWAPPPNTAFGETHVDQTLPHINWHQFGAPNYVAHSRVTEWSPEDARYVKKGTAADDLGNQITTPEPNLPPVKREIPGQQEMFAPSNRRSPSDVAALVQRLNG